MIASTTNPVSLGDFVGVMLLAGGCVVLAFVLLFTIRRKISRRIAAMPSARERIDAVRREAAGREDGHAMNSRLLETAQRLSAQLDAKSVRLEQLLDQADLRIAELRAATASSPVPLPPIAATGPPETTMTGPGPASVPAPAPVPVPALDHDPLTTAVYDLADRGKTPIEIAGTLDEQVGKVELILALRVPG